jgi:energy-coupling factor transporter ATP-binding protein EcfA2
MRNVVCWDAGEVRQVINPYAEHMPESLFRAVHSDWNLKVTPPPGTSYQDLTPAAYNDTTPAAFLEDFLRDDRPHALAAILGNTGSGKSHLVHWMRLNLKEREDRMVLIVRKSGTSLRTIVEMIINELPVADQQGFRDTLNRAGDGTSTRDGQKQQLLNDLATAIREEVIPDSADELEHDLAKSLPALFQDPYMREAYFLHDETVVADIVDHIFKTSNASNRPDQRRVFSLDDLPPGGMDYVNASKNAKGALQFLDLEPGVTRPLAVDIINRNLNTAIARTLSFSGDRVEQLMNRLRAHLKQSGRELILLIEEFARLQGIDGALLQVITHHGDDQYCRIRSAIAVTTGFFGSIAETAYMRTTHIVDMDQSAGRAKDSDVTPQSLSAFASRYLNAARLGREAIETWAKDAGPEDAPPSKCTACAYRPDCHPLFGQVDGYGLYPFTETALWNGARRADESLPRSLNPRVLQNNLLAEVLDVHEPAILTGEFPPHSLLAKLGGVFELKLAARDQISSRRPEDAERIMAFLELYDGTGEVKNLPEALRDAFGVPEIPGAATIELGSPPAVTTEQPNPAPRPASSPQDRAIEAWVGGGVLDQQVANAVRKTIFSAIVDTIDWDMLALERAAFVSKPGKLFQQNAIGFERHPTAIPAHIPVKLTLPATTATGLALQGVLRANRQNFNWDFEDGDRMLAAFLDCVAEWSREVEEKMLAIARPAGSWDPSIAALQLLSVGAAIGGKLKSEFTLEDLVDAAFDTWPTECQASSDEMISIYTRVAKEREKLAEQARATISSMKGGRKGKMLDPHRFVRAFREFRRGKWRMTLVPPLDDRGDIALGARLYATIAADLEKAAVAEFDSRRSWLTEMEESFGADATRATIVAACEDVAARAKEAALAGGGNLRGFEDAVNIFRVVQFDDAINASKALAKVDDPVAALAQYSRARRPAVVAARTLKRAATAFLGDVADNLERYSSETSAKHGQLDQHLAVIDTALTDIAADLGALALGKEVPGYVA